tara:strand:+ start:180 stop:407 length:228 start_codon:yes stop_codon:yes gene_type:complete
MSKLNELDLAELLIVKSLVISDTTNLPKKRYLNDDQIYYDALTKVNSDIVLKLSRQIRAIKAAKNSEYRKISLRN